MLEKVISGGQTGADIAGLRAAKRLGIPTGGFAARDFMTVDGPNPALRDEFGLEEVHGAQKTTLAQSYVRRSMANVHAADATVAFWVWSDRNSGTSKTVGYALTGQWKCARAAGFGTEGCEIVEGRKPVLLMNSLQRDAEFMMNLQVFVQRHKVRVLNVCGHRSWPLVADYEDLVEEMLYKGLRPFARNIK